MLGLHTATQYRELKSKYNKADKLNKDLQARINDLESQVSSSKLLVDYNELKIQHDALVNKEAIESKTIESLDLLVQNYKVEIASLQNINKLNTQTTPVSTSKTKITDVAKDLNKYKDEIKDLSTKIVTLTKNNNELSVNYTNALTKIENLNKDTESVSVKVVKAEKRISELEEINRSLNKTLSDVKMDNDSLNKDKNAANIKEASYKNRIAELESTISKLKADAVKQLSKDQTGTVVDPSKGEVVNIRIKPEAGVVFKVNGIEVKDSIQLYKGSSVTIECYKDGKLSDSFVLEEN